MDYFQRHLSSKKDAFQLRTLREVVANKGASIQFADRELINFASNNYLGLTQHPHLVKRTHEFVDAYGVGSGASRLVCGTLQAHAQIEARLAELSGYPAALLFNAGFQANCTVLPSLISSDSIIFADKYNHNSLLQGCLLSGAKLVRYPHQDLHYLEKQLCKYRQYRKIIVTESLFSMDGDVTDLDRLAELSRRYESYLYVDDSHATGVLGKNGMGLTAGRKDLTVCLGGFGKGCGGFGAYVACSRDIRDYLIQTCPGIIYTTALPPSVLGAISGALDLIPSMEKERKRLAQHAAYLIGCLAGHTGKSQSHIVPYIVKSEKTALELAQWLETRGFFTIPIRPPSVPKGTSRLRLSLSALHTKQHITQLTDSIHEYFQS